MSDPHYSTKTAFDWILAHYLFGGRHFAWVSPEFFPYRLPNPISSNPLKIYEGFYSAWKDRDEHSPWIALKRMGLRKTVQFNVDEGRLDANDAVEIKNLIDSADTSLFYPVVYSVDLSMIDTRRRRVAGSGIEVGSREFFVADLGDREFSLLFADFREDEEMRRIVLEVPSGDAYMDSYEVFEFIESRKVAS